MLVLAVTETVAVLFGCCCFEGGGSTTGGGADGGGAVVRGASGTQLI